MACKKLDNIWVVPAFSGHRSFSESQAELEFFIEGGRIISLLTRGWMLLD